jgi:hypothetical protein
MARNDLAGKGLQIVDADKDSFKQALAQANFYNDDVRQVRRGGLEAARGQRRCAGLTRSNAAALAQHRMRKRKGRSKFCSGLLVLQEKISADHRRVRRRPSPARSASARSRSAEPGCADTATQHGQQKCCGQQRGQSFHGQPHAKKWKEMQ